MKASARPLASLRRGLGAGLALALALTTGRGAAHAADARLGFRLGLAEDVGTTVTDRAETPLDPAADPAAAAETPARLLGVQLRTQLTGRLTLDLLGAGLGQALVLDAALAQTIPTAVPDDAGGALRDRSSNLEASARYLALLERPRWGLALGAGWSFASDGRLVVPSDGAAPSSAAGARTSAFGQPLSSFVVSGRTQSANLTAELQLLRPRWDLTLGAAWLYTENGVYAVAPGGAELEGALGAAAGDEAAPSLPRTTARAGTFLRASAHALTPSARYRARAGARGLVVADARLTLTLPVGAEDQRCLQRGDALTCVPLDASGPVTSTAAFTLAATVPVPTSLGARASLEYLHALRADRRLGARTTARVGLRVPSDPATLRPAPGAALQPDAAVLELALVYEDLLPGRLRLHALAGLAAPWLFQPPLGSPVAAATFGARVGDPTPVFGVTLARSFRPVDASLTALRRVSPGALGASAVVTAGASLDLRWAPAPLDRRAELALGFDAQETRAALADEGPRRTACDAPASPACAGYAVSGAHRGLGARLGVRYLLPRVGPFTGQVGVSYGLSWLDPDPDGRLGLRPSTDHAALFTLSLGFGRGPLEALGPGDPEGAEPTPYALDPTAGAPLPSARLDRDGASHLDRASGRRPGAPAPPSRDAERDARRIPADGGEGEAADEGETAGGDEAAPTMRRAPALEPWPLEQLLPPSPEGEPRPPEHAR